MERFSVDGLPIYAWPDALSPGACEGLVSILPWPRIDISQVIVQDQKLADLISQGLLVHAMEGLPMTLSWLSSITLTRDYKIDWHRDRPKGAEWKCCVYLDDVEDGGTVFRARDHRTVLRPPSSQGTIVLFDVMLEHRTDDYDMSKMRRVLGLRAVSTVP